MAGAKMTVKGTPELRARMRAIKQAFKPVGRKWATETVDLVRPMIPVRTGAGRRSVRVKNASMKRATVAANYYVGILDKGAKAHDIVPRKKGRLRFEAGGRTIFAKRVHHPRQAGRGFASRAARKALARNPLAAELIRLWNEAA